MKAVHRMIVFVAALFAASAFAADTATLWKNKCAKCHGDDGRGQTKLGQKMYINDLTDPKIQAKFTDLEAANSIKHGLKDAKGHTIMKKVRGLNDAEVDALVAYVRSLKK